MNATARRLCALAALGCGAAAIVVTVVVLWNNWLPLLGALVLTIVAMTAAWYVVTRRGAARLVATVVAVAAVATAFATLLRNHSLGGLGSRSWSWSPSSPGWRAPPCAAIRRPCATRRRAASPSAPRTGRS